MWPREVHFVSRLFITSKRPVLKSRVGIAESMSVASSAMYAISMNRPPVVLGISVVIFYQRVFLCAY